MSALVSGALLGPARRFLRASCRSALVAEPPWPWLARPMSALVAGAAAGAWARAALLTAAITAADLRRRLFLVADDSMGGRATGSRGNYQSAEYIASKNADGNAIGGLAVGEPTEKMYEMIEVVNEILPKDKPRYLMGVGTPVNILEGIERGVDMFDCVMPTRNGRNGMLFTKDGIMNMRNKKWENDYSPIEADGASYVDTMYSRAYLRHLFHAQELLAMQIASIHNLAFYLWLVGEARKHIVTGDFSSWKKEMVLQLGKRL